MVFTGLQLITLGLLAELQARTYHESQGKPIYVVREVLETSSGSGGGEASLTKDSLSERSL